MSDRRRILRAIKREASYIGDPRARRVFRKAAVEVGLVESNLTNPSGGDRDSAGFRQERRSLYKDPTNIDHAARRLREEFQAQYRPGQKSYEAAAAIQRPAAQYRGRYKERAGEAAAILAGEGSSPTVGMSTTRPSYKTIPGVDNSAQRRDLKLAYLDDSHNPDALLNLAAGLRGAQDTPDRQVKVQGSVGANSKAGVQPTANALVSSVKQEADLIDQAKVPYLWGGGHGAKQKRGSKVTPLDCSGAVSRVLGVDPRVSGQFEKWGKPGRGRVTVYANGKHVLMEIDGHFWGTSGSNPGGGAGWIPRSKITKQYLKGFKARHA